MHLKIITCCNYKSILCYHGKAKKGDVVIISIRDKTSFAIVVDVCHEKHAYDLKSITNTSVQVSKLYVDFLNNFHHYSLQKLSHIIKYINKLIPKNNLSKSIKIIEKSPIIPNLTQEQAQAFQDLNSRQFCLLYGVTGSGKGIIIIKKILSIIEQGGQALILIPEVTIANHFSKELDRFNINHIVWNSEIKNKTKFASIVNQKIQVVIGTRSALFLPFKNLQFIAVDEEHSTSYFQNGIFSYNGRDMAVVLALTYKIPIWLISATPSLESLYNCQKNKYHLVILKQKFKQSKVLVQFVDPGYHLISPTVLQKCQKILSKQKQVLVFCNRRAIAPIVKCKDCNKRQCCTCQGFLRAHKDYYQCHKCSKMYDRNICVFCGSKNNMAIHGFGVERVAQYIRKHMPNYITTVFSSDTCNNQKTTTKALEDIRNKKVDIIVGTQMIAKGHTFPHLELVLLINMDNSGIDFRVAEHGLQNLIQVIGRVGRAGNYGEIYIQRQQINSCEKFLLEQDYFGFAKEELSNRQAENLPPFTKMISLYIDDYKQHRCILDYLLGHKHVCDIYIETKPNLLFTCEKKYYISLLTVIIEKYPYCRLEIWS